MAEFENGYCTGCGVRARRWGHRPYCWRQVTMMMAVGESCHATKPRIARCMKQMRKHWRIRSLFLVRKKHMYYPIDYAYSEDSPR